jgi:OOP family OmpA-OmpF porin
MQTEPGGTADVPPILDRPEPVGFWGTWWPLFALAIMTAVLLRACVALPVAPGPAVFDSAAATRDANTKALAALTAIGPGAPLDDAIRALNMPVVNFATGSAQIPADAQPVLARAAAVIASLPPELRLAVGGHTDSTGSAEGNRTLSKQRAAAVVEFLAAQGAPRERLLAEGHGDTKPVASDATEEGRFRNRRIEIRALAP